jgi:hypothetical protein
VATGRITRDGRPQVGHLLLNNHSPLSKAANKHHYVSHARKDRTVMAKRWAKASRGSRDTETLEGLVSTSRVARAHSQEKCMQIKWVSYSSVASTCLYARLQNAIVLPTQMTRCASNNEYIHIFSHSNSGTENLRVKRVAQAAH